ncbi:MAG: hypothetical protein ABW133_10460, partial [Polyangiaceae bacterium]
MRTTMKTSMIVVAGSAALFALTACSSDGASTGGTRSGDTSMTGGSSGNGGAGATGGSGAGGNGTGGARGGAGGNGTGGATGGAGGATGGAGGTTGGAGGSGGKGGTGGTTGGAGGTTGGAGGATGGAAGATGGAGGATGGAAGASGGAGGATGGSGGAGGATGGAGGAGGGGSGMTYDITTTIKLQPGEERIACIDKRLPTTVPIDMVKISSEVTLGGHHLVFYKSGATTEQLTPFTCQTFRDITNGTVPLYIAQKHQTELNFPKGVAYAMPAGQMVRVELHFLNTTTAPLDVTGTVHITDATAGTVTDHANLMFYGNLRINIPAQSMATVGPTFRKFAAAAPKIFGLTGHTHQRGTSVNIELASAATGAGTNVWSNTDWAEPPLTIFDPPIVPTA